MTSSSRTTVLFSIALSALACSKSEPATSSQTSSTVVSSTVSATAAPPPAAPAAAPATAATATTPPAAATPNAIASAEGEKPGLRVDVTELKRSSGGTVMMKFTLSNNSQENVGFGGYWLGDNAAGGDTDYKAVGAVQLIDPVGKKKYLVMRDADRKCLCSRELDSVKPGEKANLWAKFPAPPPDVQKITIVVPHFTPMDDVPIQ